MTGCVFCVCDGGGAASLASVIRSPENVSQRGAVASLSQLIKDALPAKAAALLLHLSSYVFLCLHVCVCVCVVF